MLNQRAQERNRCKLGRNGQLTTKNGNIMYLQSHHVMELAVPHFHFSPSVKLDASEI